MFTFNTTIRLHHTDATGRIFFPQLFTLATECLEASLDHGKLSEVFRDGGLGMPVVHAESDIQGLLSRSMKVSFELTVEKIGTSSFTLAYVVRTVGGAVAATLRITHVVVDAVSQKSTPLPAALRAFLQVL